MNLPGTHIIRETSRTCPQSGHPLPVLPSDPGRRALCSGCTPPHSGENLAGGGSCPPRACATPALYLSWGPRIPCKDDPKSVSRQSQTSSPFVRSVLLRSDCWSVCTLTGPRETVWGRGGQSLEVCPGETIPRSIRPLTMRAEPGVEGEAR